MLVTMLFEANYFSLPIRSSQCLTFQSKFDDGHRFLKITQTINFLCYLAPSE